MNITEITMSKTISPVEYRPIKFGVTAVIGHNETFEECVDRLKEYVESGLRKLQGIDDGDNFKQIGDKQVEHITQDSPLPKKTKKPRVKKEMKKEMNPTVYKSVARDNAIRDISNLIYSANGDALKLMDDTEFEHKCWEIYNDFISRDVTNRALRSDQVANFLKFYKGEDNEETE